MLDLQAPPTIDAAVKPASTAEKLAAQAQSVEAAVTELVVMVGGASQRRGEAAVAPQPLSRQRRQKTCTAHAAPAHHAQAGHVPAKGGAKTIGEFLPIDNTDDMSEL